MIKMFAGQWFAWMLVFLVVILVIVKFFWQTDSDLPESDLVFLPTIESVGTQLSSVSSELQVSPPATPTSISTMIYQSTPSTKPKIIPTPTNTSAEEINVYIDKFANQYGVDPDVIRHIAVCESGLRSNATNGLYIGLFQYAPTTWSNIRREMNENPDLDLRYSAKDSIQTAAYSLSIGKAKIWPNCTP